jgi:DNA-binding GntR family transcriptional regulator
MDSSRSVKEFNPQYPIPLVEQITEFLTNSIIQGRFNGGQRLVENDLQKRFGVSRAPIRESFRILEKNGLVTITPRKGTCVRKICKKDIEENFPIRAYLEALAARLAVPNLTSEDIKKIEFALSTMAMAVTDHNFDSHLKSHSEFHEIIYKASKNGALIKIIENLRLQADWFRFTCVYIIPDFENVIKVHREILKCLITKDPDQVEALMKEHILIAVNRFTKFFDLKDTEKTVNDEAL